tara:strand:- start:2788 stop:3720 length:933 start_codon:yes stop_codon:yes gene_type:complete
MKSKNILLLGGSGNIGSNLISKIIDNNNIFILDKNLPQKNLFKDATYIKCDLLKNKELKKIPKKIDMAIFLIGQTGGPNSLNIKNLKNYINVNCETLINFLKVIKKNSIKKIIFTSTEHVYQDNTKMLHAAHSFEPSPKNYYGASKLLSEKILYNFYKQNRVNIDILRIPRVIAQNSKNLISSMIVSAIKNKKITVNKKKTNFNFIYLVDLLEALNACINQGKTGFRILNIFNNDKPVSLFFIANFIKKNLKKKLTIIFSKKNYINEHNPLNLNIRNNYTKKTLKWKPLFSNKKIIKELINIYELKTNFR